MKKITNIDVALLACPITGEDLVEKSGYLISSKARYELCNGYWEICPPIESVYAEDLASIWKQLQNNGLVSYENAPRENLGVGKRKDYIQFGEFCKFKGRVLDVGVGPQSMPTHLEYAPSNNIEFIGIDPLIGEIPKKFEFIKAFGEKVPFKSGIFDQVLFVTSLDHFISPLLALKEARRLLKIGGEICLWIGEKSQSAPKPLISPDWYLSLKVPSGADDAFHYKRFSVDDLRGFLKEADLTVKEWESNRVDDYRVNHFIKCVG